jgi:hypothetical protein
LYRAAGLHKEEILALCGMIYRETVEGEPPILGPYDSQAEIATCRPLMNLMTGNDTSSVAALPSLARGLAIQESGTVPVDSPANWLSDQEYVGNGMITPHKKSIYRELIDGERASTPGQQDPPSDSAGDREPQDRRIRPTATHDRSRPLPQEFRL